MRREQTMTGFLCMTERSAVCSPVDSPRRNEWKAETFKGKLRRLKRGGKLARGRIRGREGGKTKKREYAETQGAYLRSSHCGVAFKIDPVFRNREDPLTRSCSSCASLPRGLAVVCACFANVSKLSMGDTSGTRYLREICMIH